MKLGDSENSPAVAAPEQRKECACFDRLLPFVRQAAVKDEIAASSVVLQVRQSRVVRRRRDCSSSSEAETTPTWRSGSAMRANCSSASDPALCRAARPADPAARCRARLPGP
jgi:hypothetical protein